MTLSLKRRPAAGFYYLDRETAEGIERYVATPEQTAIIDAAVNIKDNLIINALAGAAKTSTLEFICAYLPATPILSLAFNSRIAKELAERLPGNVTCRTMNSIGHRVWGAAIGKRLVLDTKKSYTTLSEVAKELSGEAKSEAYETFSETLKILKHAKLMGYCHPPGRSLLTKEAFYASLEEVPSPAQIALVEEALTRSVRAAYAGQIDFDDQIYMPTLFGGSFPRFDLVLVDEAQDLSEINHAMLRKLVHSRIIAVGDPYQSIYAFRGAKFGGMASLEAEFSCKAFPLSVSFRCPEAIVRSVWGRVPHMKWRKEGGSVTLVKQLRAEDIREGAAIICRNNAPLLSLALQLLTIGRGVELVGTELGPSLIKALKKLGDASLSQAATLAAIDAWETERLAKSRNQDSVRDRAECLRVFARFGDTLGGAIAYATHLFAGRGAIQLLSGHKSKGLEWNTVYHLDPWRIPSRFAETLEEKDQEANLRYVISTRAREELYLIDLDNITFDDNKHVETSANWKPDHAPK